MKNKTTVEKIDLHMALVIKCAPSIGCLAQLVEHRPYKAIVGGSIPSAPTNRPSQ
jgi:hypothetical protein